MFGRKSKSSATTYSEKELTDLLLAVAGLASSPEGQKALARAPIHVQATVSRFLNDSVTISRNEWGNTVINMSEVHFDL